MWERINVANMFLAHTRNLNVSVVCSVVLYRNLWVTRVLFVSSTCVRGLVWYMCSRQTISTSCFWTYKTWSVSEWSALVCKNRQWRQFYIGKLRTYCGAKIYICYKQTNTFCLFHIFFSHKNKFQANFSILCLLFCCHLCKRYEHKW